MNPLGTSPRRGTRWPRLRRATLGVLFVYLAARLGEAGADRLWPWDPAALAPTSGTRVIVAQDGTPLRVIPDALGWRSFPLRATALVSGRMQDALIAGEDGRFFEHAGVDGCALARAAAQLVIHRHAVSGASTITMQLARILEPRPRTLWSKIVEAFRARQIERALTKDQILLEYLNRVPFGRGVRGVAAAARYWFGKQAADLSADEAAMLVAMLPAPSRRDPARGAEELRRARNRVLDRMRALGRLDDESWSRAALAPLPEHAAGWPDLAPEICEMAATERGRAVIETAIELDLQRQVRALVTELPTGPDGAAIVVLRRADGQVAALAGSRDWQNSPLNAAVRRRSAGSTLKPFLYALAFDLGIAAPEGALLDAPLAVGDWAPRNFDHQNAGAVPAGEALASSLNLPAIRLLRAVGVDRFRQALQQLGIPTDDRPLNLDAILGTIETSPLELARAWWRFGTADAAGICSPAARDRALRALQGSGAGGRPADLVVKTGTSSNRRDAWAVGMTPRYVIAVWTGRLDGRAAPELVGARAALPIFERVGEAVRAAPHGS